MKLMEVINTYLALQRSLGMKFESAGCLLQQFARGMDNISIDKVRPQKVAAFLQGKGRLSASWELRYCVLSGFYRFAISRGYVESSPLPTSRPNLPPPQSPYVYSTAELRRLIDATATLQSDNSRQQASTYRALILVLYGSGMRIGEALGLTLRDVDLVERIITVRNSSGARLVSCRQGHSAFVAAARNLSRPHQHPVDPTLFAHDTRASSRGQPALCAVRFAGRRP